MNLQRLGAGRRDQSVQRNCGMMLCCASCSESAPSPSRSMMGIAVVSVWMEQPVSSWVHLGDPLLLSEQRGYR